MTKTPLATALTAATVRARVSVTLTRANNAQAELVTFEGLPDPGEHIAVLVSPLDLSRADAPLVRVHSECMTGDIFGSARCDCGPQLDEALTRLAVEGGVLLYLRQEGRGIGLYNKLDTYVLQDRGKDTFEANRLIGRGEDERNYAVAAAMLHVLGLNRIRLLTNNPEKARQLQEHGITLSSIVATEVYLTAENARYLEAKERLGGHNLKSADRRPA